MAADLRQGVECISLWLEIRMVNGPWPSVVTFLRVFHGAVTDLDEVFLPSYYHFWPRRDFWPNTALVLVWDEDTPVTPVLCLVYTPYVTNPIRHFKSSTLNPHTYRLSRRKRSRTFNTIKNACKL